jgi:hypothetical protein
MNVPTNAAKAPKSDVKSGLERESYVSTLGGEPPEKDVKAIDKVNSPVGRKRPEGSVRV